MFNPCQKQKIFRNKGYLQWVASHGCEICGHEGVAHHVTIDKNAKGTSIKTHDYDSACLCVWHHDEHDRIGQDSFWNKILLSIH